MSSLFTETSVIPGSFKKRIGATGNHTKCEVIPSHAPLILQLNGAERRGGLVPPSRMPPLLAVIFYMLPLG
jgi:hypothetical protein